MERDDLASLAGFFASGPFAAGSVVQLGEDAAHHMRVRRLAEGDRVFLADGAGAQAVGVIVRLAKGATTVTVDAISRRASAPAVHMLVPVADRDRMLWLAEKCAELEATSWRPVLWHRSRSVSPRGEGAPFAARVHARMVSALVQSRGPWLPAAYEEAPLTRAVAALSGGGTRLVLDSSGEPIADVTLRPPVTIAVGPEGGLEAAERDALCTAGFRPVSLGANVLRFETAGIAALAIVRSALAALPVAMPEPIDG